MPDKKQSAWRYLWFSQDIRRKLLITMGILILFRIAANVPAPGVDRAALQTFFAGAGSGGFIGFLNLLSGGTLSNFSVLAMGVYPYITAQIILQLLVPIIPALEKKMKDDPREGRKWMEKWTYYLAVPMAALSAIGQINTFNAFSLQAIQQVIIPFGFTSELWLSSVTTLVVMTAGTMFAIWLGELISEYGIRGQGLSLVIFAGIVSQIPQHLITLWNDEVNRWSLITAMVVVMVLTILAVVYVQQGRRNVPIIYPQKSAIFYAMQRGKNVRMPQPTLPLMVNLAGMIPLIFASALLQFPAIVAGFFVQSETVWVKNAADAVQSFFNSTGPGAWGYWTLYFLMVVGFTYFYTTVLFDQQNYGDSLKRSGAQIPGVHSGTATQKYLSKIQSRITLPGALLLGVVAIMPFLLQLVLPAASSSAGLFLVSSSGLLIVVGVVRDTFMNIEAELKLHGYQEKLLIS
ncbi:MAG: preprotein translocase subunit SecY [Chloroflexota bacterium]|nr:preprotein translocase subunit SecY [Chloroflexota bacterium]MBI5703990.1 preprotein translocase subunit SecY [Chloroflexota bacterium]